MGRRRQAALAALSVVVVALTGCGGGDSGPPAAAEPPGRSPVASLQDDRLVQGSDPEGRVRLSAELGAAVIRVDLRWDLVATRRPASPADPADPAYVWTQYDRVVVAAQVNRVEILFSVWGTPAWAQDSSVRTDPRYPNWAIRPKSAGDFGGFAEAAARRYSPRGVRRWEGWNEPNIALFLRPQYERRSGRWAPLSPKIYSDLQKAFYAAVRRAAPRAVIAGGVTAPAGDRRPGAPVDQEPVRVTPDDFIRALDAKGLRPPMDIVSHHPYPLRAPTDRSLPNRTYVDLYNLDVLTTAIDGTYLRGKRLWLTEYGFSTKRVDNYPLHFRPALQAAFISDAYRRVRANPRVRLLTYYLLQDNRDWGSGLLNEDGSSKPGIAAFSLPLAVESPGAVASGASVRLVGQVRSTAGATKVRIEWRNGKKWSKLQDVATAADGSFAFTVRPSRAIVLRAKWTGRSRAGASLSRTSADVQIRVR